MLKLYAGVKERMEAMQQHNMSWIEVQFLKKAVDVLCQCRQTLMYTYVFAFYLQRNNQSIIFEVQYNFITYINKVLSFNRCINLVHICCAVSVVLTALCFCVI